VKGALAHRMNDRLTRRYAAVLSTSASTSKVVKQLDALGASTIVRGRGCIFFTAASEVSPHFYALYGVERLSLVDDCGRLAVPLLYRRCTLDASIIHSGLHSSVSYGLARLLALQPGEQVLDPCCGTGSLLFEAKEYWPHCTYIGTDIDESQLEKAAINIRALATRAMSGGGGGGGGGGGNSVSLVHADCGDLPLRDGSIDAVVSDLPFGKQFGSIASNIDLFPRLLREVGRLLLTRVRGRAVLLTSAASAPALTEPTVLKAAGLTLHAALPTRHCNLKCVTVLLVRDGDASDGSRLFDMSGVVHDNSHSGSGGGEAGPGVAWLSWRRDQLVSVPPTRT
jgi:ubiquinone/menaquinone biosynthesis C-methylase UbiE